MRYRDVLLEPTFFDDWEHAPPPIRKKLDKILHQIGKTGIIPAGMNIHKAAAIIPDIWIGYVTRTKDHWRVLFYSEGEILTFHRLLNHAEASLYLKQLCK